MAGTMGMNGNEDVVSVKVDCRFEKGWLRDRSEEEREGFCSVTSTMNDFGRELHWKSGRSLHRRRNRRKQKEK